VVVGDGPLLGPPLIEAVDYVSFTGSTPTGKIVARQAAERLIGCSLELGGKNAMLVLDDADVERAAAGAVRGCFGGAGQVCVSLERVYVAARVYERFRDAFIERTRRLEIGPHLDYRIDVGSLANARQLAHVQAHVQDAQSKGATVLAGGRARPDLGPYFYEPTILEGVTQAMTVWAEETFGPVVSLNSVASVQEAVERANDSPFGLAASVWSRDERRGLEVASHVQAGSISVNEGYTAAWAAMDAPMGGFKQSGLGRRHGAEGLLKYTQAQTVAAQRLLPLGLISPPLLGAAGYSRVLAALIGLLGRVPGLR
jgi:succinate-semialdehyde dehydrogenase / glutarate-semialdehyde dehydrogenase